jgi:hypothetical protein
LKHGSSEIAAGSVGPEELGTVHEHIGPETTVSDVTAHDGEYGIASATVACGFGEDLLSVSIEWPATGGHNERHFVGITDIERATDPDTATVQASFDGGGAVAKFRPVAVCIF